MTVHHDTLTIGDACPDCAEGKENGKLCAIDPGVVIKLEGHPLITGKRYWIEKLRCSLCGHQYSASLPAAIAHQPKYSPSCLSTLAISHYHYGLPFKRIESWQHTQGIPLPDASQWDKIVELHHIIQPVHQVLETQAAQGSLLHYDDTHHRILSHTKAYQQGTVTRKGIYTTAVIAQVPDRKIYLFYTGACYAGENIADLLDKRETDAPLITMSDASAMNIPTTLQATLLARWILCYCLVHGRRKFHDLLEHFEKESQFVLTVIGNIYQHEATCKTNHYSPKQRLLYHQQHSAPLMTGLHHWLTNQLVYEQTEPNSGLGQAVQYLLKHWVPITQFLQHEGAPIDNNLAELTLKAAIRYRKNSLFFKTPNGAHVGDCFMSLIHTAAQSNVNVFDYLNQLQLNAQAVAQSPEDWLPWTYHQALVASDQLAA